MAADSQVSQSFRAAWFRSDGELGFHHAQLPSALCERFCRTWLRCCAALLACLVPTLTGDRKRRVEAIKPSRAPIVASTDRLPNTVTWEPVRSAFTRLEGHRVLSLRV